MFGGRLDLPPYLYSPVQGVILDEMRMYVVGAYGNPARAEVMKRSGRPANHVKGQ